MKRYLLGFLLTGVFASPVFSQEQVIEEVIVTVTAKEESSQDLPISITALSSTDIEARQVQDIISLSQQVPGFTTSKAIGNGSTFAIRGYGSFGVGAATINSYVTASNGHSAVTGMFGDIGFFDVDRIEVLKGPQGTLYGRNAVGGVINFITSRPTGEFEGYAKARLGNYNSRKIDAAINLPLSPVTNARIAFSSVNRDGWVDNLLTGNNIDDRDQMAFRFSLDREIGDSARLQLTYEAQSGDDKRFNIGQIYCSKDPLLGCDPFSLGTMGQPSHKAGAFTGVFNVLANLTAARDYDPYAGMEIPDNIDKVNHNIDPKHVQDIEFTTLEFINEFDTGALSVKLSYSTREYYHHQENEYGVGGPLPGSLGGLNPQLAFPITFDATFYGFNQYVDSDRQYEFSDVSYDSRQAEIRYASDLDGDLNFVVGAYMFHEKTANIYLVQSAALQMMADMARHPYNAFVFGPALQGLSLAGVPGLPSDFSGYGGTTFFTNLTLGLAAGGLGAIPTLLPALAAGPKYTLPHEMQGFFQDSHNVTDTSSIFGEIYYDLTDSTKLTVGFRYDEFENFDDQFSSLGDNSAGAALYRANYYTSPEYIRYSMIEQGTESDASNGKIALQQYLTEDSMIYLSWTSATKSGGSNPNEQAIPDPYLPEDAEYVELGLKGRFFNGRMLANLTYFSGEHSDMIISTITDAGSKNTNLDAEIDGFEGQFSYLITDDTRLDFNFLTVDSVVSNDAMLVDALNINAGTVRVPFPDGSLVQTIPEIGGVSTLGFLRYGLTDAGPVYKFAGYSCTNPFFNPLPGPNNRDCGPNPFTGAPGKVAQNVKGNTLPSAPDFSYNIAITQTFYGANGSVDVRLQRSFMGEREGNVFNNPALVVQENSFWDLNMTYTPNEGNWYVGAWAQNLEDDRSIQVIYSASNLQGGSRFANHNNPLTYGLSFGVNF